MAERKRSKDGKKETEELLGAEGKVDQQGRSGGNLERKIGTRDEAKRVTERPAGKTRVQGEDKRSSGFKKEDV